MLLYIFKFSTIVTICKLLTFVAVFQLILISISVYKKKISGDDKFLFILLLLSFGIFLTGNFIFIFIGKTSILKVTHLGNLFVFLSSPLLYLLISLKLESKKKLCATDILHIIPFILVFSIIWMKIYFLDIKPYAKTKNGVFLLGLLIAQNIIYLIVIFKKLVIVGVNFFKPNKQPINSGINWFKRLFVLVAPIIILQLLVFIFGYIIDAIYLCYITVGISFLLAFIMINNIVLFGISNAFNFDLKYKYSHTQLSSSVKMNYIINLNKALNVDEVYLDPLINLEKLSNQIHIPKHYLSQIINDEYGLNFNDLINKYRIKKIIEILNNQYKGDAIINYAYEVGFNAKSTFNRAFKKYTNLTPTQYLTRNAN